MVGVHRQLPDVWDAIHQLDTDESHGRLAGHKDERCLIEVVLRVVVRERTDPHGLVQLICCELDVAQVRELVGSSRTD